MLAMVWDASNIRDVSISMQTSNRDVNISSEAINSTTASSAVALAVA
jgi:hypothetical protein